MKRFACGGLLAALAVCGTVLFGSVTPAAAAEQTNVGLIEIHGKPTEQPSPMAWLLGSGDHPTLRELVDLFFDVAGDDSIKALVVRLREAELTTTQVQEIGQAMEAVRASGKKIHLFADNYETAEMLMGSYADEVIMQTGGAVSLPGMHMEEMYLADTLSWAGLQPQMVQVGDYKGASEQMMRAAPSPQWDQNISGLLDSLYSNLCDRIQTGRRLDRNQLLKAMETSWMATGETAIKAGLIDAQVDLPALTSHLEQRYPGKISWTNFELPDKAGALESGNLLSVLSSLSREPNNTPSGPAIALVHVDGPIADGDSTEGGLFGEASVGSHTIRRALSEIEDQPLIKGVIVRIDSPGGSAIASEVIWQGVKRLSQKKPVWVSVGSMAASGGYYIAVSGQKIYVNPSSIVGSIGVVGGKIALAGLMDKLKVHVVERSRGPMAAMMSTTIPWTPEQISLVRNKMTETYDLFTSRVTSGRKGIDLSQTAEGRLFTGTRAIELKMADKVGSLEDTVNDLAAELKLEDGEFEILDYPGPKSLGELIGQMLGGSAAAPNMRAELSQKAGAAAMVGMLRELVGEQRWPLVRDHLGALMQLRKEPVVLTAPRAIIVK